MKLRRCLVLYLEPRETVGFSLQSLLDGGAGLRHSRAWIALAPHVGDEVVVDESALPVLSAVPVHAWIKRESLTGHDGAMLDRLLDAGLLISDGDDARHAHWRERDEVMRAGHWHPLSATMQAFTRWRDVDAMDAMHAHRLETASELREKLGAPPPVDSAQGEATAMHVLPRVAGNAFDELLERRATCRNFDASRPLPLHAFAQLVQRVFHAKAVVEAAADVSLIKRSSPSGGGLHPTDAFFVIQNVEGMAPGLYRYSATRHALSPLKSPDGPIRDFLLEAMAGQAWFADAHAVVALAPRFGRAFWKYRQHPKAWRVLALDAGHLSQTLYLAATEAGLGAFVTAGINEMAWETALALDPLQQGVVAVCGFGWRGHERVHPEFDPQNRIWQPADA